MSETVRAHKPVTLDWRVAGIVATFGAALALSSVFRYYNLRVDDPPRFTAYATWIYIGATVLAAVLLTRIGVPMRRLGFGGPLRLMRYVALAAIGVGIIQLAGLFLDPILERALGETRDLARFSDVAGSMNAMIRLMALSWTVAAFGEELVFGSC